MRIRWTATLLVAAALAGTPALSQTPVHSDTGTPTETQERHASGSSDLIWNLLGMVGLLGLSGLWRPSDNDGYTDDPV